MSSTPASSLYVPRFNVMDPDHVRPFVEAVATAQLVTVGEDGVPDATFLPVLWEDDRLVGHLARANPHWRRIVDGSPALAVVTGPDTYVSPSWYATKAEHGKVVPTWNYSVVHLRGRVTVHDDPAWVRGLVTRLTDRHERDRDEPWAVADAPADYVASMAKAIVGIEIRIDTIEGAWKLSQNRPADDRASIVEHFGTATAGQRAIADLMRAEPG